MGVNQKNLMNY